MDQTTIKDPRLSYLPAEQPAPGLAVNQVELASKCPQAPFKTARFTVAPGRSSPVDSHQVHEIWTVVSGSGELIFDSRSLRARENDVFYFEPLKTHEIHNDGIEPITIVSVWWS
jgi:mannose-6-phosphate isomerase-like protein (cupin superfamily)